MMFNLIISKIGFLLTGLRDLKEGEKERETHTYTNNSLLFSPSNETSNGLLILVLLWTKEHDGKLPETHSNSPITLVHKSYTVLFSSEKHSNRHPSFD